MYKALLIFVFLWGFLNWYLILRRSKVNNSLFLFQHTQQKDICILLKHFSFKLFMFENSFSNHLLKDYIHLYFWFYEEQEWPLWLFAIFKMREYYRNFIRVVLSDHVFFVAFAEVFDLCEEAIFWSLICISVFHVGSWCNMWLVSKIIWYVQ